MRNIHMFAMLFTLFITAQSQAGSNKATATACSSTDGTYHTSSVNWSTTTGSVDFFNGKYISAGASLKDVEGSVKSFGKASREGYYGPIIDENFRFEGKLSITTYEKDKAGKSVSVTRDYGVKEMSCRSLAGDSRDVDYFGKALEFLEKKRAVRPVITEILKQFPEGGAGKQVKPDLAKTTLSALPILTWQEQEQGLKDPTQLVFHSLKLTTDLRTIDPEEYFDIKYIFQGGSIVQLDQFNAKAPHCDLLVRSSYGKIIGALSGDFELNGVQAVSASDWSLANAPGLTPKVYYVDMHIREKVRGQFGVNLLCFPDMTASQVEVISGGKISVQVNP